MRILIIEDDVDFAFLISEALEELDYEVQTANNFTQANQLINADTNLLIVDYSIKGDINAEEWINARIEANLETPPFIMSTGQGDERIAVKMMKLGARDYVIKDTMFLDRISGIVIKVINETQNEIKLKLAEDKVHEISEFYKSIIENSTDGIALLNKQGLYTYVSPSGLKMFGYREDEIYSLLPNHMTHPDDLQTVLSKLDEIIKNPTIQPTIQYRFKHKSGEWIWIESTFTNLYNNPNINSLIINFRNVTDRKKQAETLQLNEQKYRIMFANNPHPMWLLDAENLNFIEVNQSAIEHYGYNREEFLTMKIVQLRPKEDLNAFNKQLDQLIHGEMNKYKAVHLTKKGKRINVEITALFTNSEDKKAIHILINDITERVEAEQSLKLKMDELIRFQKVTVGRELSMINLKKEINELLEKLGEKEKYRIIE